MSQAKSSGEAKRVKARARAGVVKADGTISKRFISVLDLRQRSGNRHSDVMDLLKLREIPWFGHWSEPYVRRADIKAIASELRDLATARRREAKALRAAPGGSLGALTALNKEYVYFIQCGEFVKIGYAYDVPSRLKHMRVGNPYPLTVLAVISGDREAEAALHRRFRAYHHQGDWFRLSGELQAHILEIVEQSPGQVPWVAPPRSSKFRPVSEIIDISEEVDGDEVSSPGV